MVRSYHMERIMIRFILEQTFSKDTNWFSDLSQIGKWPLKEIAALLQVRFHFESKCVTKSPPQAYNKFSRSDFLVEILESTCQVIFCLAHSQGLLLCSVLDIDTNSIRPWYLLVSTVSMLRQEKWPSCSFWVIVHWTLFLSANEVLQNKESPCRDGASTTYSRRSSSSSWCWIICFLCEPSS